MVSIKSMFLSSLLLHILFKMYLLIIHCDYLMLEKLNLLVLCTVLILLIIKYSKSTLLNIIYFRIYVLPNMLNYRTFYRNHKVNWLNLIA